MLFEEAVCAAATTYGTEPFMTESAYRESMASGRIRPEDIVAVLNAEADGEIWNGGLKRRELRLAMLLGGVRCTRFSCSAS